MISIFIELKLFQIKDLDYRQRTSITTFCAIIQKRFASSWSKRDDKNILKLICLKILVCLYGLQLVMHTKVRYAYSFSEGILEHQ